MSKLYVEVTINQEVHEPYFPISLPDEEQELIVAMYSRALEKSGMEEDTFGPQYYQQLKKEDKDLADMLESAVYSKLYTLLWTESTNECVQAMRKVDKKDLHGNYYQDFAFGNRIDIDMTGFPKNSIINFTIYKIGIYICIVKRDRIYYYKQLICKY